MVNSSLAPLKTPINDFTLFITYNIPSPITFTPVVRGIKAILTNGNTVVTKSIKGETIFSTGSAKDTNTSCNFSTEALNFSCID